MAVVHVVLDHFYPTAKIQDLGLLTKRGAFNPALSQPSREVHSLRTPTARCDIDLVLVVLLGWTFSYEDVDARGWRLSGGPAATARMASFALVGDFVDGSGRGRRVAHTMGEFIN